MRADFFEIKYQTVYVKRPYCLKELDIDASMQRVQSLAYLVLAAVSKDWVYFHTHLSGASIVRNSGGLVDGQCMDQYADTLGVARRGLKFSNCYSPDTFHISDETTTLPLTKLRLANLNTSQALYKDFELQKLKLNALA